MSGATVKEVRGNPAVPNVTAPLPEVAMIAVPLSTKLGNVVVMVPVRLSGALLPMLSVVVVDVVDDDPAGKLQGLARVIGLEPLVVSVPPLPVIGLVAAPTPLAALIVKAEVPVVAGERVTPPVKVLVPKKPTCPCIITPPDPLMTPKKLEEPTPDAIVNVPVCKSSVP